MAAPAAAAVARQLAEFFSGQRKTFDLPMAPAGTDFQKRVWGGARSNSLRRNQSATPNWQSVSAAKVPPEP